MEAIPDYAIETMARALLPTIRAFFDSPEGKEAFARWKEEQDKSNNDK